MLVDLCLELGKFFSDEPAYDQLFEEMMEQANKRKSAVGKGEMLLERGKQKLLDGKPYEAIRFLGRAQRELPLYEARGEFFATLMICGLAYEQAGLLWAARANYLVAANIAQSEYAKDGTIIPQFLAAVQRLVWLEIQLGRIPEVLSWVELANMIAHALELEEDARKAFIEERNTQDTVRSATLRTRFWQF